MYPKFWLVFIFYVIFGCIFPKFPKYGIWNCWVLYPKFWLAFVVLCYFRLYFPKIPKIWNLNFYVIFCCFFFKFNQFSRFIFVRDILPLFVMLYSRLICRGILPFVMLTIPFLYSRLLCFYFVQSFEMNFVRSLFVRVPFCSILNIGNIVKTQTHQLMFPKTKKTNTDIGKYVKNASVYVC